MSKVAVRSRFRPKLVMLDPEDLKAQQAIQQEYGMSINEQIRRAIRAWLAARAPTGHNSGSTRSGATPTPKRATAKRKATGDVAWPLSSANDTTSPWRIW